jgi:hypothetical protein
VGRRLRDAVELMADVPFAEGWQLSQVWAVLEPIEDARRGLGARLRPGRRARAAHRRLRRAPGGPRSATAPSWWPDWRTCRASRTA